MILLAESALFLFNYYSVCLYVCEPVSHYECIEALLVGMLWMLPWYLIQKPHAQHILTTTFSVGIHP